MTLSLVKKPQLLTDDVQEQRERIDGAEVVRRLVERFSVEDVHRWLKQESYVVGEPMPCERAQCRMEAGQQ